MRQLLSVKDLMQFERFIRICAGRIGQVVNLEGIGREVGISSHTVKEWLSILEASFIIFRLIYAGDKEQKIHQIELLNYKHATQALVTMVV